MPNPLESQGLDLEPGDPKALSQQAIWYARQGRLDEAIACFEDALRICPDSAETYNNLGNTLYLQGRHDRAVACYQQALCLSPDAAEICSNLGTAFAALKRYDEAVSICQQALWLQPNYAKAYNHLGNAYKGLGKLDEAIACYQHALRLRPTFAEARLNSGVALIERNRLDQAVANFREALQLNPEDVDAWSNVGLVLIKQAHWDTAVTALQRAVQLRPDAAELHYNLGYALSEQGNPEAAGSCFRQALLLRPDYAEAHWALSFSRLVRGDFEQGWPGYEWRWRFNERSCSPVQGTLWDGSPLAGRNILLHAEQGLGDTIQFIRYAAVVKQYGGTVIVQCQKSMLPLLATCSGIDRLVATGSTPPPCEVHAPLLSLPRILKTSLASVPAKVPYLASNARLQDRWQRKLGRSAGFKVGIAWQGNPRYGRDSQRSIPLIHFGPLARIDGVCLMSLQKGPGTEQQSAIAEHFHVMDLGSQRDQRSGAFMDTAAIMTNLDLVITSDTAIAHLAGALAVPVWVALSFVPDWRWLLERADSPWYPSMRLFRQTEPGNWVGVFDRMARALSERLAGTPRPERFQSKSHRVSCLDNHVNETGSLPSSRQSTSGSG